MNLFSLVSKLALLIPTIPLVAGCSTDQAPVEKTDISILYSSNSEFMTNYGDFIKEKFGNVNLRVIEYESVLGSGMWNDMEYVPSSGVDWDASAFIDLVKKEKPDILFFPSAIYQAVIKESILEDVTELINSNSELAGIEPTILESMQTMGDGRTYFLPDTMASQAIFYNEDIFSKYNIPEPTDFMSWDDILKLSSLLSNRGLQDGIIGLQIPNYGIIDLFFQIGKANGLQWHDIKKEKTYFSSDSWKSILNLVIQEYKLESKFITLNKQPSFIDGNTAMVLDTFRLRDQLSNHKEIHWKVVTEPIGDQKQQESSSLNFQYMSGVNESSSNLDEAKEIWAFLNGKEIARSRFNADWARYTLPVRSSLINDYNMQNLSAFYKLSPMESGQNDNLTIPIENEVKSYLFNQLQQIVDGEIDIDQATSNWDMEVPEILLEEKKSQ